MKRILACATTAAALIAALPSATSAQQAMVPLKLDLVISRQDGTKKVASMPYSLWVTANAERGRSTSLRMGVELPVASTVFKATKEGEQVPQASYSYRNVGTNIDCTATTTADGKYSVAINLTDTGVQLEPKESKGVPGVPSFRTFQSQFSLLLKDGQSATYTSATDPVTGETLKVDVTLTVLK